MQNAPQIDQVEFSESDFLIAEQIAKRLGYEQTAYTSTSAMWGLFCLQDNPAHSGGYHAFENSDLTKFDSNCRKCGGKCRDSVHNLRLNFLSGGCIIKTKQFGFLFVADLEDLHLDDLNQIQKEAA